MEITKITIGRTISMEKFSNEKQEVEILFKHDPEKQLSQQVKEAYELAEKAFITMYPKSGTVNPEYAKYIAVKKQELVKKAEQVTPKTEASIPIPPAEKIPVYQVETMEPGFKKTIPTQPTKTPPSF